MAALLPWEFRVVGSVTNLALSSIAAFDKAMET
jgi:hypothetical protein